ncbi:hypothetical protein PIB30_007311 [Stylosanthes scabra]|uniref:GH3 C-terminal domain-containing protein n=1 Tax=Stylosanthes scabra TaxID=79078 RepID=A0ABU6X1V9_9FABA|nr:hypothetical protein [Stylosanthes scabra]
MAGTVLANVFSNPRFNEEMKAVRPQSCSPVEVMFGPDYFQSLYCHLLCGLIFHEEVQFVASIFAHSIVHAFRTFEQVWEELCTDIKQGVLSSRIIVPSTRAAMSKLLKPNPELANLIHAKCMGLNNWYGLIPKLFPKAKYVYGIMTGSMEPYVKKLRHYAGQDAIVKREGDVVKIVGFHNSTPEMKFVRRSSLVLTINIDKTTETDLQSAVEAAGKVLAKEKLEVVDFTSHVDLSKEPGHYVISWEINGEASEQVLGECCNCLDKSFVNNGYITSRKDNSIGPLELRLVRTGTFQKILEHSIGLGAAVNQYKTPRCVAATNTAVLQILTHNVVKTYFSTAF